MSVFIGLIVGFFVGLYWPDILDRFHAWKASRGK